MPRKLFTRLEMAARQVEQPLPTFMREILWSDLATRTLQTLPPVAPKASSREPEPDPRTYVLHLPKIR
jgi:hypothetical protein